MVALPSRSRSVLLLFGPLLGVPALAGIVAAIADNEAVGLLAGALGFLSFTGATILAWWCIFRGRRLLDEGHRALDHGDGRAAEEGARWTLTWAFRGDLRFRAAYLLGLAAERAGRFEDAIVCFQAADRMIPTMAAPKVAAWARAWVLARTAFSAAVLGRREEALAALHGAHGALQREGGPTTFGDNFLDDSGYGLGAASMNSVLRECERRRHPRIGATLAGAMLAYRDGSRDALAQLLAQEQGAPYVLAERALLAAIAARVGAPLPPAIVAGLDDATPFTPWTDALLLGPHPGAPHR